jgi:nucleoside-diphosphate-sugar epimerase
MHKAFITGIKGQYGENFISVMPNNLYGSNDNFDLKNSHVLPALMRKFHKAKVKNAKLVEVWETFLTSILVPERKYLLKIWQ